MQTNVRAHEVRGRQGKPCVFARLRLRSNVHTSDARVRAVRVERGGGGGGRGARRRRAPRAQGEGTHGLFEVARRVQSRRRLGGVEGGGQDGDARALRGAQGRAPRERRATPRALPGDHALASDADRGAPARHCRAGGRGRRAGGFRDGGARDGETADGAFAAATGPASSPEPPPPPPRVSPTPDSPASDFSVDTPAFSPETFGVVSVSESASPSPSPSPAPARLPARRTRGLVEQAFAALVRVAARAQTLEPDAAETADFRALGSARGVRRARLRRREVRGGLARRGARRALRAPRATGDDADVPAPRGRKRRALPAAGVSVRVAPARNRRAVRGRPGGGARGGGRAPRVLVRARAHRAERRWTRRVGFVPPRDGMTARRVRAGRVRRRTTRPSRRPRRRLRRSRRRRAVRRPPRPATRAPRRSRRWRAS